MSGAIFTDMQESEKRNNLYVRPFFANTSIHMELLSGEDTFVNFSGSESHVFDADARMERERWTGLFYQLCDKKCPSNIMKASIWTRPHTKVVPYPVINYPSDMNTKEEVYAHWKAHQMAFIIVVLSDYNRPMAFWAKYFSDIPIEQYKELWKYKKEDFKGRHNRMGIASTRPFSEREEFKPMGQFVESIQALIERGKKKNGNR